MTHLWWCLNNHVAPGYPPFAPCGCAKFVESGRGEPDDQSEPRPDSTTHHDDDPTPLPDKRALWQSGPVT